MADAPKVSVIMNCFNSEKYLKEALDSVYAQTYADWEIVFWDNASTDGSAAIAKHYGGRLKYFRGEETIPLGAARNKALEKARGEFIAFLDCDDIWLPEKLSAQVPLFGDPEVGLVYSDTFFFNETGFEQRFHRRRKPFRGRRFLEMLSNYCLSLETVVIRKAALLSLREWFDPRFSMIEEYDLFARIAHGWKVDFVAKPLSKWRVHSGSLTWTKAGRFVEETERMLDKYRSAFPEFQRPDSREVKVLERSIAFQKAKNAWNRGEGAEARRLLRGKVFAGPRFLLFYLATFFSKALVYKTAQAAGISVFPASEHEKTS